MNKLFLLLLLPIFAYASGGDKVEQETKVNTKISGDSSIGLGVALGDVDISGCVVTKQFSIIIFARQDWEYDPFCIADKLDVRGKYADAAATRCTDKDTAKLHGDRCLDVMNFEPPEVEEFVEEDDRYIMMQMQIDQLQEQIEQAPAQAPAPRPQVVQKPFMTDEKRAKLQAILNEDGENE